MYLKEKTLTGENKQKLKFYSQMLLQHNYLPRSKSKECKEIYDFMSIPSHFGLLEEWFDNLGFKIILDKNKEVIYLKSENKDIYEQLKKRTYTIMLILLNHYRNNTSGVLMTDEILVSDIKKALEFCNIKNMTKTEFSESISYLEKYHFLSYDCSKERIFNDDTIITVYPSILCGFNPKDEIMEKILKTYETPKEENTDGNKIG